MAHPPVLYIERESEEGRRAIELMNNSGAKYQLFNLSEMEALEQQEDGREMPRLLAPEGIFDSIKGIEAYCLAYCKN
ncbi:hypothetical protein J4463_04315 [Candidatus Pacearchaeota archaeon]|nr:hypothetical protein [Candidatus Pacearchaeota archaeon]